MRIGKTDQDNLFIFFCPACNCGHQIDTKIWSFNNDFEKPTIRASVLVKRIRNITDEEHARICNGEKLDFPKIICHSFVTDGKIQFLDDCTHELKGQTIDLPDLF
jgi:hypothetical protein